MKPILLFLSILLSSTVIFSQGWELTMPEGIYAKGRVKFVAEDTVSGTITIAIEENGSILEHVVSKDGQLLSTTTAYASQNVTVFETTEDGGYLVGSPFRKVDANGTEIWDTGISPIKKIAVSSSGNIFAIGNTVYNPSLYEPYYIFDENGVELVSDTLENICTDCRINNGGFIGLASGGFAGPISSSNSGPLTHKYVKVDDLGNFVWETPIPVFDNTFLNEETVSSISLPDSSIVFIGVNTNQDSYIVKFDYDGNIVWQKSLTTDEPFCFDNLDLLISNDGNILVQAGRSQYISDFPTADLWKFSFDGDSIWQQSYGAYLKGYGPSIFHQTSDGDIYQLGDGYLFNDPGYIDCFYADGYFDYLLKFNSEGEVFTNEINGTVFLDETSNCIIDGNDVPLSNRVIKYTKVSTSGFALTDENGYYSFQAGEGDFAVELLDYSNYWSQSCQTIQNVSFLGSNLVETFDFAADANVVCPLLNVDLSTFFLRRCFDGRYTASYCNEGTEQATAAYLEISLDPNLIFNGASAPYTVNGNVYTFQLGDIGISACGEITIDFTVDCTTGLGHTHCSEARIFPDVLCAPTGTAWDGADLTILENCQSDSLHFSIQNKGQNMASPGEYRLYENSNLIGQANFQLNANEVLQISLLTNGNVYRLEADETPNSPGYPLASKTNIDCNNTNPVFLADTVNMFVLDEAPFVSRDCQDNVGSYDPNDKSAFPLGCGIDHLISGAKELEYLIRFQNTGTDTAFTVVLKDELSEHLDISTIRPGGSSHPYTWYFESGRQLHFQFDNIDLLSEAEDEAGSQGYVKFRIKPVPNLTDGTLIPNKAEIYFDFNAPIITNETRYTIGNCIPDCTGPDCPVGISRPLPLGTQLDVYPNPVTAQLNIELQGVKGSVELKIYDALGRLIWMREADAAGVQQVDMRDWPKGIYLLSAFDGQGLGSRKIVR